LGRPPAALLAFTLAVLAYNVLSLLKRFIEHAHHATHPDLDVSTYHLAVDITADYGTLTRLLPPEHLPRADDDPESLAHRLLLLAARMRPKQLATSKRQPKTAKSKAYVDARTASSHFSTARVLKNQKFWEKTLKGLPL